MASSAYHRNSLFDLTNRTALVTGGGSGIGLMIAQTLATNGARVYITGRSQEKLEKVVAVHGPNLPKDSLIPVTCDVTDKASISQLYDEIASREKCLCILVNNAGIAGPKLDLGSAGDAQELRKATFESEASSFEDWDNTHRTNAAATFFVTAAFLPLLQKSSDLHPGWSAAVLNIASISGSVQSSQLHFAYNSSKAAAIHVTRMLAYELANRVGEKGTQDVQGGPEKGIRIRVNAISPGLFPSEMTGGGSDDDQKTRLPEGRGEQAPARRPGRDEDMASAVLFVVTNQYLNGQNIVVDGGLEMAMGR